MMSARLAWPCKSRRVADKDVDIRHLFHDLISNRVNVITDQSCCTGLVDGHPFNIRKGLERLNNVLLEHFFSTENDMLFFYIRGKRIFELKVIVVTGIALGLPGVVGAPGWSMTEMDNIFHRRTDNMLCSAVRASPFRNRSRNRIEISKRKGMCQILTRTFYYRMLFPFRNTFAAFKLMIWHNYSSTFLVDSLTVWLDHPLHWFLPSRHYLPERQISCHPLSDRSD